MQEQIAKYLGKMQRHGLIEGPGSASLFGLDDELYTNASSLKPEAAGLFDLLNINSLIIARPEPMLWQIISHLAEAEPGMICPRDCESLTFIHDIPVIDTLDPLLAASALNRRKGCIVRDTGIVTTGTVSLEQAFVYLSSICFAVFVKFFTDAINALTGCGCGAFPDRQHLDIVLDLLEKAAPKPPLSGLSAQTPETEDEILSAMDEAGRAVVETRLVDSFFGNISFRKGAAVYISQTGSSLDELLGHIDRVPLDGSSTCAITSSSELLAHVKTYEQCPDNALIHGHPRFSVIMSMAGETLEFGEKRFIGEVPVIAGEVGAGSRGLCHTLPAAMQESHCAIVAGHGTFTSCTGSFRDAYLKLHAIEDLCYTEYRRILSERA